MLILDKKTFENIYLFCIIFVIYLILNQYFDFDYPFLINCSTVLMATS